MHGHASGDKEGLLVAMQVFGVDEITFADAVRELTAEFIERFVGLVA